MPWLSARKTVSLCIALEAALSSDESIINRLNKNVTKKTRSSLHYLREGKDAVVFGTCLY